MIGHEKNKIFPFFVLSVVVHIAVFYVFFYQGKKESFIQIPVEVAFYSPVKQNVSETAVQQDTDNKKKPAEVKNKKDEIALSKKEEKKKNIKEKKEEKKPVKEEVNDKKTLIDGTKVSSLQDNAANMQSKTVMFDDANFKYNYYTNAIVKKIGKYWQWSSSYASLRAVVYFKIDRSGNVHSVKIKDTSGDDDFDQNAIRAVQLASPFAPLPDGYEEKDLGVYFEFKFR